MSLTQRACALVMCHVCTTRDTRKICVCATRFVRLQTVSSRIRREQCSRQSHRRGSSCRRSQPLPPQSSAWNSHFPSIRNAPDPRTPHRADHCNGTHGRPHQPEHHKSHQIEEKNQSITLIPTTQIGTCHNTCERRGGPWDPEKPAC